MRKRSCQLKLHPQQAMSRDALLLQRGIHLHPKHRSCAAALRPDVVDATANTASDAVDGMGEARMMRRIRMQHTIGVGEAFAHQALNRRRHSR